ncbi:hypothetical protein FCULG_00004912 [Fusarium culmorum]|uniref:Uncharacterized protein n=1 Tax=Fusarium culmorum TaxID=5516 RepID=A0A2T4H8I9_FUSCU|nr:hypothetical protein FCULG_00004912 [Fusarium culmorum]
MWDAVTNTLEATKRESELKNTWEFRSWMLSQGNSYHRYQNTTESARMIVNSLAGLDQPTRTTSNKQMVKKTRHQIQSFVGQEVQKHLIEERKTFEERLRKAETYMREVNENETYLVMYQERCRYEKMFKGMESKTAALRANMEGLLAEKDQRINDLNLKIMRQQSDQALALARVEAKQAQMKNRFDGYLMAGVEVERIPYYLCAGIQYSDFCLPVAECNNLHSRIKTGVNVDPLAHWIHNQPWYSSTLLLVGRFGVFVSITDCLSLHESVCGRNTSTGLEYDRTQFGIYKPTYGPRRERQMMTSKGAEMQTSQWPAT